jgi:hypothetical protein
MKKGNKIRHPEINLNAVKASGDASVFLSTILLKMEFAENASKLTPKRKKVISFLFVTELKKIWSCSLQTVNLKEGALF